MTEHLMYILDADGVVPTFNTIETKQEDTDEDEISEKPIKPLSADGDSDSEITSDTPVIEGTESESDEHNPFPQLKWIDFFEWNGGRGDYRLITKPLLLAELQKTTKWAMSYGAGYVGESHFIYNILRHKHYDYDSVKDVLESLISEGKVERRDETHDEHTFSCLVLKEE